MGMSTIERVQLVAVAATALVAGGGYYWAATYTPPGRGGTGWGTVVIVLLTMAEVALCGAAVALFSLIRYADCESKAPLDHLEAGLAGLALASTPLLIYGLPLPLGVLAVSVAALCVTVLARAGYATFTAGRG
ncbi:hypothetical protein BRD02_12855 [Halobacteriales archaeon QS_8_69_73]|nr:MAG: hypothetical protein BRD02_12855 [Halobacteriales archaeon QS_8_69_73]